LPNSPLGPDRILRDSGVRSEDDQTVRDSLTNEYPVERVLVVLRQSRELQDRFFFQRQRADVVAGPPSAHEPVRRLGQRQLAQLVLDDDFSHGSHAQVDLVVGVRKEAACGDGEVGAVRDDPEKRAGVQEDVQSSSPENLESVSAGSSSKNVAGTAKLPLARPIARG